MNDKLLYQYVVRIQVVSSYLYGVVRTRIQVPYSSALTIGSRPSIHSKITYNHDAIA
jgi:hypothetical protein